MTAAVRTSGHVELRTIPDEWGITAPLVWWQRFHRVSRETITLRKAEPLAVNDAAALGSFTTNEQPVPVASVRVTLRPCEWDGHVNAPLMWHPLAEQPLALRPSWHATGGE